MAIMDYHSNPHFNPSFDIYSAPSSTRSSPPEYDPYPHYTTHYPQQPPLQVLTDHHHNHHHHHDDEPTAHPSRPHTYQFRPSSSSSQHEDDSYGDILPNCVGFNRPLNHHEQERIAHLDRLKFFLATAPSRWDPSNDANSSADTSMMATPTDATDLSSMPPGHPSSSHPALNRFLLPTSEYVSCVLWNGLYHITGTDIVRALVFRFEAFGRPVRNMKKFEEGIFSDLRNLKPGVDACLEEPKVGVSRAYRECHLLKKIFFYSRPSWIYCSNTNVSEHKRSRKSSTGQFPRPITAVLP